jgi:CHAD domain-containing protein
MGTPAQLLLSDGVNAEDVLEGFSDGLSLNAERSRPFDRVFLDTFDGRVHEQELALFAEDDRLVLAHPETYVEVASGPFPGSIERVLLGDLPSGELRDRLAPILENRALAPVARLRGSRRPLRVCNDDSKTVVRLTLESPGVVAGSRVTPLTPRVTVVPIRGYPVAHDRVVQRLRELGLTAAERPVHLDAVAAAGGIPGGISSKPDVILAPAQPADGATRTVLLRLLDIAEANIPGTIADIDSEFLHDLRVSVRRTRSVVREMKSVFPSGDLDRWKTDLRWLQQITGPVRDLDVHLAELPALRQRVPGSLAPDLEPLATVLDARRAQERRRLVRTLRSARTSRLFADWRDYVTALPDLPTDDRPDARRPVVEVAASRIRKVYKQMVAMGQAIDETSPPEDLHDLRKKGKELRYLLELFGSPFPSAAVKSSVAALKGLQDVLGRYQDTQVQAETLHQLGDEVARQDRGPAALMAIGLLMDRLYADQTAARDEFAAQFAVFAATEQRELVKSAFRP